MVESSTTPAADAAELATIEGIQDSFRARDYVCDRSLATATFLALQLDRPLLLEGEAGVGKTELAKVLAASLGARLIRLQCYEGLDVNAAVYEWNYPRQMLEIRLLEARGEAEVWQKAMEVLEDGGAGVVTVDLTEPVDGEDKICGGVMDVFVERIDPE